jgi:hypothetical protein
MEGRIQFIAGVLTAITTVGLFPGVVAIVRGARRPGDHFSFAAYCFIFPVDNTAKIVDILIAHFNQGPGG